MIEQASLHNGCLVINKDFGEFPFEKLLSLQDDNFAKPNQYQTIWRNVIFNLFIQAIASLPDEDNSYYREIKDYKEMYLMPTEQTLVFAAATGSAKSAKIDAKERAGACADSALRSTWQA